MKNRWIALVLTLALCLSLMPASVMASGDDTGWWDCRDYDTLVAALADPNARTIEIRGRWEEVYESGDYKYFSWPAEEVTLVIDRASYASIYIYEDWNIPENVTVQIYDAMSATDNTITVDGDWYMMSNYGYIDGLGNLQPTLIFNGDVYANASNGNFVYAAQNVFNGNLRINERGVSIANMVLGNGAKVTGQEFEVWSFLSCPEGSATIESDIAPRYISTFSNSTETVTLSGNLNLGNIRTVNANLVIAEGSKVTAGQISISTPYTLTVNGHLILPRSKYQSFGNSTVTVNEGGVVTALPGVQLGGSTSTGTMSGDGTLKLYAEELGDGLYNSYPILYGRSTQDGVKENVTVKTIWKNWTDGADCVHSYDSGVTVPATCNAYAKTTYTCTQCGYQKVEEDTNGGYSDEHDWRWYTSSKTIGHSCNRCREYGSATLTVANGIYTGEPVTGVASASFNENWVGGDVTFSYENNVEAGENTAVAYMHCNGYTVKATFSIFEGDCAHAGGTATCYAQAVCEKCGEGYGSMKNHGFSAYAEGKLTYNADCHIYHCCNEGCTETKEEAHRFYASDYDYEMGIVNGTGATSHSCLVCGYGSFDEVISVSDGVATVSLTKVAEGDHVVAAVYDENGKFLGCGAKVAEATGAMDLEVSYQGTGDYLKVFFTDDTWSPERLSSENVSLTEE